MKIPGPLIAIVSQIISDRYTHSELDNRFLQAGFPTEVPAGNKLNKCRAWLSEANKSLKNPLGNLAKLIEDLMDIIPNEGSFVGVVVNTDKEKIEKQLAVYGLTYRTGGRIDSAGTTITGRTLEQIIGERDLRGVEIEFERILNNINSDPGIAVTASCALLESLFKAYIADEHLQLPSDQSILPLWKVIRSHLSLNPGQVQDENLRKILSGIASIVDGIAGLRTGAGSAHGHDVRTRYKIEPRHARLAAHAAMTLASFLIEAADSAKARLQQSASF